nr:hypothetical protein [Tanacetum cinerariifolium]
MGGAHERAYAIDGGIWYSVNKVQQMGGAHGRAYAIDGGIWTNGACSLPGKVEKGRANAMEVVEWAGMEERWGKNVWRENRFEREQCMLY